MGASDAARREAEDDRLKAAFAGLEMAWAAPGGRSSAAAPRGRGSGPAGARVSLCAEAAGPGRAVRGERRRTRLAELLAGER